MPAWKGIVGKGFTASDFSQYVTTVTFNAWRPQFVVLHNTAVPTFADWHFVPVSKSWDCGIMQHNKLWPPGVKRNGCHILRKIAGCKALTDNSFPCWHIGSLHLS